jgi:hypothetical protein
MRIVEYKMVINDRGEKTMPSWMLDGGYFFNDRTYVGVLPKDEDTDYYIPSDQYKVLTLQQLTDRSIAEQNKEGSANRITNEEGEVLDDEGVALYMSEFWNSYN